MTAITTSAANASADPRLGSIVRPYVAASAVSMLQVVYLDSNGQVAPADADAGATQARGIGIVVGAANLYGETSVAAGGTVDVCLLGPVYGFSGMTPGGYGWVGKTAGVLDDTKPTSAIQRIMGHAIAADIFFVLPGQAEDAYA